METGLCNGMKKSFSCVVLFFAGLLGFAQLSYPEVGSFATANSQGMTLVQLTDLALQRNTKTRLAWSSIRASEAGVALARAGYWPQIDATVSAQRNRALNFSGQPAAIQSRYGASVSLSYLLWDFGVRSGMLDQGKFELASAQLSQQQVLQDVILQVELAYYQVLGLQAVLEVNRQSLLDAETNLAAAQDRRAAGLATVGDVYKAEAALAGSKLAVQQATGQLASARGALAVATGNTPDTQLLLAAWDLRCSFGVNRMCLLAMPLSMLAWCVSGPS